MYKKLVVVAPAPEEKLALEPFMNALAPDEELIVVETYEEGRSELRKRDYNDYELLLSESDPIQSLSWAKNKVIFTKAQIKTILATIEEVSNQIRSELRIAQAA